METEGVWPLFIVVDSLWITSGLYRLYGYNRIKFDFQNYMGISRPDRQPIGAEFIINSP